MNPKVINIKKKLNSFNEIWNPKIVGELNGQHIKLAKFKDEFVMHKHEDKMFIVIKGTLLMELENDTIEINEGEFVIIPKGVNHKPIAKEEVSVLLFEPDTTINTGNTNSPFKLNKLDTI